MKRIGPIGFYIFITIFYTNTVISLINQDFIDQFNRTLNTLQTSDDTAEFDRAVKQIIGLYAQGKTLKMATDSSQFALIQAEKATALRQTLKEWTLESKQALVLAILGAIPPDSTGNLKLFLTDFIEIAPRNEAETQILTTLLEDPGKSKEI